MRPEARRYAKTVMLAIAGVVLAAGASGIASATGRAAPQVPPVGDVTIKPGTITFLDPCAGVTSSPPWDPEPQAVLYKPNGAFVAFLTLEGSEAGHQIYLVPADVPPGRYDLAASCFQHRVTPAVVSQRSTITWQGDPTASTSSSPPASGPAAPSPNSAADPAVPVGGQASYTG